MSTILFVLIVIWIVYDVLATKKAVDDCLPNKQVVIRFFFAAFIDLFNAIVDLFKNFKK